KPTAPELAQARARRRAAREAAHAAETLHFAGNGGKRLGTVRVKHASRLTWTNDGDVFTILDSTSGLFVNSQAHSGDSAVDAGTYTNVVVAAVGNWTIAITPVR